MRVIFFLICFTSYSVIFSQQRGGNEALSGREGRERKENKRTVLDDSTKVIYGMKTTRYLLKNSYIDGDTTFITLDSSLTHFEKVSVDEKNYMRFQGLGNIGTPTYDFINFYPKTFELSSGLLSLDEYYLNSSIKKFYDTRSPFIDLSLFFGRNGRSLVDFTFSRNINKNWNFGFDIHRISADKQFSAEKTKGDKNITSSLFKIFTYHNSKNKRILFYSDYTSFRYSLFGTGGIDILSDNLPLELFTYNDFLTNLKDVESRERRGEFNAFINFKVANGFDVYNDITINKQLNGYFDDNYAQNVSYYNNFYLNNQHTSDSLNLMTFNNKIGIKGVLNNFNYNIFGNYRRVGFQYSSDSVSSNIDRLTLGGKLNFSKKKNKISTEIKIKSTGDYSFTGLLESKIFKIIYKSSLHEPEIIFRRYQGNHFRWDNNFKSSFVNVFDSRLLLNNEKFKFEPYAKLISVNDFIYLSDSRTPEQFSEVILVNHFGVDFSVQLFNNSINIENKYTYTILSESSSGVVNIPKHLNYSRIYYSGKWFEKSVPIQFGVNMYYRSKYFGNAFEPVLQSFFVQNSFPLDSYLMYNVFFNMQISNLRIFLKMDHFSQFDKFDGYFVTPYYPGQKKVLDLGVRWYFFN